MNYKKLNEQGETLRVLDKSTSVGVSTPRTITSEEFHKLRPKLNYSRRVDFVFKNGLYQEITKDLALFLTKKFKEVVILTDKDEELVKEDLLELVHNTVLCRIFPKIYKKYYKEKLEKEHWNLTKDSKILFLRQLFIENDLDVNDILKEFGVDTNGLERTTS